MRIAVISTQNRLLSGAIIKYMQERSELRPVRILEDNDEEPLKTCKSVQADVLLMEVNQIPPFTFSQAEVRQPRSENVCHRAGSHLSVMKMRILRMRRK